MVILLSKVGRKMKWLLRNSMWRKRLMTSPKAKLNNSLQFILMKKALTFNKRHLETFCYWKLWSIESLKLYFPIILKEMRNRLLLYHFHFYIVHTFNNIYYFTVFIVPFSNDWLIQQQKKKFPVLFRKIGRRYL